MLRVSAMLIVDDERGIREGLTAAVEGLGHRALPAPGLAEARRLVSSEAVDCVLLDIRLRDGDGLDLLRELRGGAHREIPVVVATAYGDSDRTIEAMRDGAFDYVTKPFDLPLLLATVERALRQRTLQRSLGPRTPPPSPAAPNGRGGLIGTSAAMLAIWKQIGRAAASDAPVLITGETGTGKELVARAIHEYSPLAKEPFVAVNLAALPASLIESELFGHERGAFTGATARRAGRFELAQGGTLFLDEIGDLDALLQTKLLRVLQDGRFERVGGSEAISCRARVLTATNKPVRPGVSPARPCARISTTGSPSSRSRSLPSARAAATSRCWWRTPSTAPRPAPFARTPWRTSRATSGPATCGSCSTCCAAPPRCAAGRSSTRPTCRPCVRAQPTRRASRRQTPLERLPLKEAVAALERRMIADALERAGGNRSEAARQLGIAQGAALPEDGGVRDRGAGGEGRGALEQLPFELATDAARLSSFVFRLSSFVFRLSSFVFRLRLSSSRSSTRSRSIRGTTHDERSSTSASASAWRTDEGRRTDEDDGRRRRTKTTDKRARQSSAGSARRRGAGRRCPAP